MQQSPADRFLIRGINQSMVLNLIRIHAPVSRPQLAVLSGLSSVTVMKITSNLLDRQLIQEKEQAESTGGRRAGLLEIYPEGGFVIGLIPQPDSLTAVLLNLNNDLISSRRWSIMLRDNYPQAIDLIAECIEELFAESGIPQEKIIGVGVGISGLIDAERGICIDSWVIGWRDAEISRPLEKRLGIPVFVDNDVNCLAIYEKLFGQGQPYHHFLVVAVGRGVGLGIIINDDLYRGAFGGAGEFGHTAVTTEDGRLCSCGNYGCLETYISEPGIVKNYLEYVHATSYRLEKSPQALSALEILERACNGDEAAVVAIRRAGLLLGVSLANLINIFNPECVILASPDTNILADNLFLEPMHQELKRHVFSQMGKQLSITTVQQPGYESWARGSGSLVLRHFFAPPARIHSERLLGQS